MGSAANFGPNDYYNTQYDANMPGQQQDPNAYQGSNPYQPGGMGVGHHGFQNTPGDMGGANGMNPYMPGGQVQPGGYSMGWGGYGTGQGGGNYFGGDPGWSQNPGGQIGGNPNPPQQQPGPTAANPFQNLQKGTMGSIRDHMQAGNVGRAKQAYEQGGGTWNSDVSKRLRNKYG